MSSGLNSHPTEGDYEGLCDMKHSLSSDRIMSPEGLELATRHQKSGALITRTCGRLVTETPDCWASDSVEIMHMQNITWKHEKNQTHTTDNSKRYQIQNTKYLL